MWDVASAIHIPTEMYELAFKGAVTDVAWNPNYHVIAACGFGDQFPILVYYWEKDRETQMLDLANMPSRASARTPKDDEDESSQYMESKGLKLVSLTFRYL